MEYSQRVTVPVFPVRESVPEFPPMQTVELVETVPPTVPGSIVIETIEE